MREIDFEEIKSIWAKNTAPAMLYIHSPFCRSICTYCVYRGRRKDDKFDKYFNEYLPAQIDKYTPIIEKQDIEVIFFGGGTPNIVPNLSNLESAFEKIRHLKAVEKVIELHFNIPITDETISKIAEEGFTTVILCIQTFNRDLLARKNRINEQCNDIETIIKKFHDEGVKVASDIIYFHDDEDGYASFLRDMRYLSNLKNPLDEITIDPCFQGKTKKLDEIAVQLERVLGQVGFEFCDFDPNKVNSNTLTENSEISNRAYVKDWESLFLTPVDSLSDFLRFYNSVRLIRYDALLERNIFRFATYLDETQLDVPYELNPNYFSKYTSVIGIGSYLNPDRNTHSQCGPFSYSEIWDGKNVKYFLTAERTFYQKAHDFLNWMEKVSDGKEPDLGTELTFRNYGHKLSRRENVKDNILDFDISLPYHSEYIENISRHKGELEDFYRNR